ncbi:hypothetical protein N8675_03395 [Akkermansiaceae bacterium]|nr:hypothetical protein [Akkermansiaceae bacterium]
MSSKTYEKILSANDVGKNGGHQGGVCVPKANQDLISFFPTLDASRINPDAWIECIDPNNRPWRMRYIYYNGKLHGKSTRNEYRITHMTKFFREWNADEGDSLLFEETDLACVYRVAVRSDKDRDECNDARPKNPPVIILKSHNWNRIH